MRTRWFPSATFAPRGLPNARLTILTALLCLALGVLWRVFAPTRFGGLAEYVMVNGVSMLPQYHKGDLVILQQAQSYAVGDVATYRHPDLGPVIHRIIALADGHFVFQGDNNSWVDEYHPSQAELMGKAWLHLPNVGTWLETARQPWALSLLVGGFSLTVMMTIFRVELPTALKGKKFPRFPLAPLGQYRFELLFICIIAGVVGGVLLWLGFTTPVERLVTSEAPYSHRTEFRYRASGNATLFDSGHAQTGDPIFLKLTQKLTATFAYQFTSETLAPTEAHGTYTLLAEVSDPTGWKRTLVLQPATEFAGMGFTVSVPFDITAVQRLIAVLEAQTGLQRSTYQIALIPQVEFTAKLAGQTLDETFAPRFNFRLSELMVEYSGEDKVTDNRVALTQAGVRTYAQAQPNTASLLGLTLPVLTARWLGSGLLLGVALALGAAGWAFWRIIRGAEEERIQFLYGALLMDTTDALPADDRPQLVVANIEALVKLAERDGRFILHQALPDGACYSFATLEAVYQYRLMREPMPLHPSV